MIFFIGILFFLLIIDHIYILTPKEFVDIGKKSNSTSTESLKW